MRTNLWVVCLGLAVAALGIAQPPTVAMPLVRQGGSTATLSDVPQQVMFVKSETTDPKAAIANVLLSEQGIHLLTMGLAPGLMWNPYMNEAVMKAAKIGKGMILAHSNDLKGFEYDTLPGLTASTTFKPGKIDLDIPLDTYRPSADFQIDNLEPRLLRLETRPKDQMRVLASRRVSIKEQKKGRFDLKPTSLREETDVQEQIIPVELQRQSGNVLHISTREPLPQGEYALVLRTKSENGAPTQNIPLKSTATPPAPAAAAPADPMVAMMGMGGAQAPQQPPQRKGLFGGMGMGLGKTPPNKPDHTPTPGASGFLAWDFRVIE